jgi:very-short-patch-repair endonuclease
MFNEITERARNLRKNQTPAEKELWKHLKRKALGIKFIRQKPIIFYTGNKKNFFIADFFSKEASLVIELDGKIHQNQKKYDQARDFMIKEFGFKVLRFKNEEIFQHIEYVLNKIKENLPHK